MSRIPQIPEPVPFQFHGRTDYTTVYKAVDFPLDRFAILKQNPVNRDRITEANKLIYALQKQVNELRATVTALAVEMDENVEKKVKVSLKIGNEAKDIEASLLKDEYTFTIPAVSFGEEDSITATAEIDATHYIVVEGELECAEGADLEVKGTSQEIKEGDEPPAITIKKSTEPTTFTLTGKLQRSGQEDVNIEFTIEDLTARATFEQSSLEANDVIALTLSKGYKFPENMPAVTTASTELEITVTKDESQTEDSTAEITVTQA